MDKITHEVRLTRWTRLVEQCQSRPEGQTIAQWCKEAAIASKTPGFDRAAIPFRRGRCIGECRKSQAATTVKYVVQSNIRCCGSPFQAVAARECYKESLQLFEQLEAVRRICSSAPGRFGQLREEYLSCMIW